MAALVKRIYVRLDWRWTLHGGMTLSRGWKPSFSAAGFPDAFNPQTGWVAPDAVGINVCITLVMAENLRSGMV